jgi:VWFA-related protein
LKVTAQNVVLDVVVTDRNGHNVQGLTKNDFTVYEDKDEQTIRSFEEVSPKPGQVVAVNSTAELDKVEPDAPVSILVIDELTSRFEDLAFTRYSIKKYLGEQGDTAGYFGGAVASSSQLWTAHWAGGGSVCGVQSVECDAGVVDRGGRGSAGAQGA